MRRIKFKTSDVVLMGIYGLALTTGIIKCILSDEADLHQNIIVCIWIASTIGWFFGFKMASSRFDRMFQAADKNPKEVLQKSLSSAPSILSTYESSIYDEGFKDGVNYIKNEMNSAI
jgi:hypothetical protein